MIDMDVIFTQIFKSLAKCNESLELFVGAKILAQELDRDSITCEF